MLHYYVWKGNPDLKSLAGIGQVKGKIISDIK